MKAVIFAGPSLPPSAQPAIPGVEWRPPARQGDVYRAAREGPDAIGLIDGYFDAVPSVWHKEILWAMAQGIRVYGAASLGALRAAELAPFGMIGVGWVFEQFRDGVLTDDDEVAVLHAPAELDYRSLSVAMVDIRATLVAAVREGVVSGETAVTLTASAKERLYKERDWLSVLATTDEQDRSQLEAWLADGRVRSKWDDAIALVKAIGSGCSRQF
jgi:hypothetical protein